mmetsp:Transcript_4259/g.9406  ORF Transcript_4259/g.9406 Transcript_4259/m.9406 type:complete len:218 (+) Transcript_4259:504-1157(+)
MPLVAWAEAMRASPWVGSALHKFRASTFVKRTFSFASIAWFGSGNHVLIRASRTSLVGAANLTLISRPPPYRVLICWQLPRQRNCPSTWIATREHKASASSMECVVIMTTLESLRLAMLWITSHMYRRAYGSIPADGSSRKMIGGSPIVAMATLNFRLLPPDNWPALLLVYSTRSISFSRLSTAFFRVSPCSPLIIAKSSKCSLTVISSSRASNWGQ